MELCANGVTYAWPTYSSSNAAECEARIYWNIARAAAAVGNGDSLTVSQTPENRNKCTRVTRISFRVVGIFEQSYFLI